MPIYCIYAKVLPCVASSLDAGGLPGYPECLVVEIYVLKSWQSSLRLYWTQMVKTRGLKLYTKCLHVRGSKISTFVQVEGWQAIPS